MRTTYKPGYGERQRQREFVARLLQTGFAPVVAAEYAERKYQLPAFTAAEIVRYVQGSLARTESKP